jgi:two-component system, NarL family, response regulator LiaR
MDDNERGRPIRVMLVDDHAMVRDGLKVFLSNYADIEVVAEADDGAEALALCARFRPDVVLMDLLMPELDGPTATARIRSAYPHIQVIALTSFVEEDLIRRALRAGAVGYLLKDVNPARLAEAIRAAHRGRPTIDSAAAQVLARGAQDGPPPGSDLTPREREVLALLVQGKTNDAIARDLSISAATVRLHVSHILSKLEAQNRTEAATIAARYHLAPLSNNK